MPPEKSAVVPVGNEANVLAVPFFCVEKALRFRNGPSLRLGKASQREPGVRQLILGQCVQKIALILGFICRFFQQEATVFFLDLRVVAGHHIIAAHFPGNIQKSAEFQMPVADHAGVGRQSLFIAAYKIVHNLLSEIF